MLTLQPAYGRNYTSMKAVKADWDANKDFTIASFGPSMGRYINKQDANGQAVSIRYQSDRLVMVIK